MKSHAEIIFTTEPEHYDVKYDATAEVLDTVVHHYGIDDARSLKSHAYQTAVESGVERVFVIRAEAITTEAQQALLKLLEEPPRGVQIIFVVRIGVTLLPTVLSRCRIIHHTDVHISDTFTKFLQLSYRERLALIDEQHRTKKTEWFTALQAGLGEWLCTTGGTIPATTRAYIQSAYVLLGTRGASNKFLSEHIALCLPDSK